MIIVKLIGILSIILQRYILYYENIMIFGKSFNISCTAIIIHVYE